MANAKPMDMRSVHGQDSNIARPPAHATVAHGFIDGKAPASSGVAPSPVPAAERVWAYSNLSAPARSTGKLFFQEWAPTQRKYVNYVCSATVIAAENASTVWTAGHCVYNTYSNIWNRTYMFCPGYRDNNGVPRQTEDCPFGQWTPRYQNTTTQWKNSICKIDNTCTHPEFTYDFGTLRMYPQNGLSIQRRVGSHVLRYNIQVINHYAFGYPADPPFTGRYLYTCIGTNVFQHGHLRQPCGMTGGASGGPWLATFNSGWRGWVDTVNSHGGRATGYIDAPFQGLVAQQLYNSIRNL
jgi:V8-like Glu-specific endopeptidase